MLFRSERSLVLLQTRLALVPEDRLTDDYLKAQYLAVLESLVEAGLLVVTSFTQPTIDEATWFGYQRSQIARFRE